MDRSPIYGENKAVVGFTGTNVAIDSQPGWVNRICIQGMGFGYDHVAVLHHDDYVEVVAWNDDADDWDSGEFVAYVWKFYPAEENKTIQHLIVYAGSKMRKKIGDLMTGGKVVPIYDWSGFVPPDDQNIRHGVWMTDTLFNQHKETKNRSWREWIGDPV